VAAGPGLEAIYLLASYDPIENIEELVDEPEGSSILESRRMLLETTVAGLLDGRHGFAMRVRTRTGRPIVSSLPVGPSPGSASATLASGATESRPLATQPGLLTASVELRVGVR